MTQSKKPIIVSFDGNIGSGKSSIIRYFEKNFEKFCNVKGDPCKICFLEEPVDIWDLEKKSNEGNTNTLSESEDSEEIKESEESEESYDKISTPPVREK